MKAFVLAGAAVVEPPGARSSAGQARVSVAPQHGPLVGVLDTRALPWVGVARLTLLSGLISAEPLDTASRSALRQP